MPLFFCISSYRNLQDFVHTTYRRLLTRSRSVVIFTLHQSLVLTFLWNTRAQMYYYEHYINFTLHLRLQKSLWNILINRDVQYIFFILYIYFLIRLKIFLNFVFYIIKIFQSYNYIKQAFFLQADFYVNIKFYD